MEKFLNEMSDTAIALWLVVWLLVNAFGLYLVFS